MQISGGTYLETCREPLDETIAGSGMRAAAVLQRVCPELVLKSAIDASLGDQAEAMASGLNVSVDWVERSEPVAFDYWTPLSAPTLRGPNAKAPDVHLTGTAGLVFGMVEATTTTDVERLVFDPQQPKDLGRPDFSGFKTDRLALVANSAETQSMTGEIDLATAARSLLESTPAEVVVTKRAARGSLVTTSDGQEDVGLWPTSQVWPIGSGDVFAAGFAWAWAQELMDPVQAARVGSHLASLWCGQQRWQPGPEDFDVPDGEFVPQKGQVYLAGPFFTLSQRWLVELVRESLLGLGGTVFSPLHDVGLGADEVAKKDLDGLDSCTAMLALLDDVDSGVLFESGWARRDDIPVIVYTEHTDDDRLKMVRGSGAEVFDDLSSAVYRALWASMGLKGKGYAAAAALRRP
jgi:hypothetical protein